MRIMCAVLLLAAGAAARQPEHPSNDVAVIVDSESPAADAEQAARLRERALVAIQRTAWPAYFELRSGLISPVPEQAVESFRRAVFTHQPKTYSGVHLTFAEAIEVLRGNEALRDAVILRECAAAVERGCAGAVHAAAMTLVVQTEMSSARKLRHLVETAASRRFATLVLVTPGWLYSGAARLDLDRSVRELRASGVRLGVLREPPLVPYQGRVRDVIDSIVAPGLATLIPLDGDRDLDRIHEFLRIKDRAEAVPRDTAPSVTEGGLEPRREDVRAGSEPTDETLQRAAEYVARFEETFSSVIWRERSRQESRQRRRFNASGATFTTQVERRQLESELLFVWLPADRTWIIVRDVIAVDGEARDAKPGSWRPC